MTRSRYAALTIALITAFLLGTLLTRSTAVRASSLATLTSPTPSSTLVESWATFTWTTGSGVSNYRLQLGSSSGGASLYDSGSVTATAATVLNLPSDSSTIYVTLWSEISGSWTGNTNTYTLTAAPFAAARAQLTSPSTSPALPGATVTFTWTVGTAVQAYALRVGSTAGGYNYYNANPTGQTSTVTGLPTNGSTVYVRLWSEIGGSWGSTYYDYTFTAATLSSGGGSVTTPTPSSTLTGPTVTFSWSAGTNVQAYALDVGSTAGGTNYFASGSTTSLSATVPDLPVNGSTVYVTVWSEIASSWSSTAATYTAATQSAAWAQLTSPTPSGSLTSTTVTFGWSEGTDVQAYALDVGSSVGSSSYYSGNPTTQFATVTNLPATGGTVYVRLWSEVAGSWGSNHYDYTYTAWSPTPVLAVLTTPTPSTILGGASVTLSWNSGTDVAQYSVNIGSSLGAYNYLDAGTGNTFMAVTGLPTAGSTIYVRLWSEVNGSWTGNYHDYTYTAASPSTTWSQVLSPAASTTLPAATVTFIWSQGSNVQAYSLYVGSSAGSGAYYTSGSTTALAATVSGLPINGSTIYVRLWSEVAGSWGSNYHDTTYTAYSPPGVGLSITSLSPSAGTTGGGTAVSIRGTGFSTSSGATGVSFGGTVATSVSCTSGTSCSATSPNGSGVVDVRVSVSSSTSPVTSADRFTYQASSAAAALSSPTPGSTLSGANVTFSWSAGTGVQNYQLQLGTAQGSNDLYDSGVVAATSASVTGLPTNGITIYAQLWSEIGGSWGNNDASYTFTASSGGSGGGGTAPGTVTMTAPYDGLTAVGTTPALSWSAPSGSVNGTTTYSIGLWDPSPAPNGTALPSLAETTALTLAVPASEALQAGQTYFWNVSACNGTACSAYASQWYAFSTAAAPATATLTSPPTSATTPTTTPTLSWSASATGAISGTTTYTVALQDTTAGQRLPDLPPTTALSVVVPAGEGLVVGHSYSWGVNACNGELACSGFSGSYWWSFTVASTAAAPGTVSLSSPANAATNVSPTAALSWSAPSGTVAGTEYTASLWDPYGDGGGHLLGDLGPTTATSIAIPASEGLLYGQAYYWNVTACNGANCSAYGSWSSFVTQPQPAVTLSGAGPVAPPNPDFSGPGGTDGWTWSSPNSTSAALTLDFATNGANYFHLGYQPGATPSVSYALSGTTTPLTLTNLTPNDGYTSVASSLGSGGSLVVSGVTYVERLDTPTSGGNSRLGATLDPRFPKPVGAIAAGGVDVARGAYVSTHTDLSLAGLSGTLSFTRAYDSDANGQVQIYDAQGHLQPASALGPKWSDTYAYRLIALGSTGVVVQTPGSGDFAFLLTTGNQFVPPKGVDATLVQTQPPDGNYTLTTSDQTVYTFTYAGTLVSIADRNGNTTTLSYNASGALSTVTDPGGRSLTLSYTGTQLTSVSDSASRTVSYAYNASGDLASVTDVLGNVTRYAYSYHWLTQITDPLGNVVLTNSYDSNGRVIGQQDAAGGVVTLAYATPGAGATQVTNQQQQQPATFYFDTALRVTDVVDPYGNALSATYDADNNTMSSTSPAGSTVASTVDVNGNVLTATDAENYTWTYAYDGKNDRIQATDPLGHTAVAGYDSNGNLVRSLDANGEVTQITRDGYGQATAVQDPRGNTASIGYNTYGDQTTVTDQLGHTTTTAFDSVGRSTSVTDPLSHVASKTYDAAGNVLTATISPSSGVNLTTTNTYDADGHLHTVTDPLSHVTTYAYEVRGLLYTVTDANSGGILSLTPGSEER